MCKDKIPVPLTKLKYTEGRGAWEILHDPGCRATMNIPVILDFA